LFFSDFQSEKRQPTKNTSYLIDNTGAEEKEKEKYDDYTEAQTQNELSDELSRIKTYYQLIKYALKYYLCHVNLPFVNVHELSTFINVH
jgi:hypothetical protein